MWSSPFKDRKNPETHPNGNKNCIIMETDDFTCLLGKGNYVAFNSLQLNLKNSFDKKGSPRGKMNFFHGGGFISQS